MMIDELKKVEIPEQFGGCSDCDNYDSAIDIFDNAIIPNLEIYHGVSKLVFLTKEEDKVVKIPFNGEFCETSDGDVFEPFCGAPSFNWDYCALEAEIYKEVAEAGFGFILAKTELAGHTANGYPFYTQEKVTPYDCYFEDEKASNEEIKICESYIDSYHRHISRNEELSDTDYIGAVFACTGTAFMVNLIKEYTLEKIKKFAKWCYKNKPIIYYDLHDGNYGYRKNDGTPCILDYSGWFG